MEPTKQELKADVDPGSGVEGRGWESRARMRVNQAASRVVERLGPRARVLASRTLGTLGRLQLPRGIAAALTPALVRALDIDLSQACPHELARGYRSMDALFVRRLAPGARSFSLSPRGLLSPCDGFLMQNPAAVGHAGRRPTKAAAAADPGEHFTIKGSSFDVATLVADEGLAARLKGGRRCVLYLAPGGYHRVHAPCDATLDAAWRISGGLGRVDPASTARGAGTLATNERAIIVLNTERGLIVLVLVAAFGVSDIEVCPSALADGCVAATGLGSRPWAGAQARLRSLLDVQGGKVGVGEELAVFHLGSTVVVLTERALCEDVEAGARRQDIAPSAEGADGAAGVEEGRRRRTDSSSQGRAGRSQERSGPRPPSVGQPRRETQTRAVPIQVGDVLLRWGAAASPSAASEPVGGD